MNKTKLFTILFTLLFVITGCDGITELFDSNETMNDMEALNDEFSSLMESEGYALEIVYKGEYDGDIDSWYSLGDKQFVEENFESGILNVMMCNVDGEYNGTYEELPYVEYGLTEDVIIETCDESMQYYNEEYDNMLADLYNESYDINYKETDENLVAYGVYENTGTDGFVTGKYEMSISKDKNTLVYDDEHYTATITIGKKYEK